MNAMLTTALFLLAQLPGMGGAAPQAPQAQAVDIYMTAFYALRDEEVDDEETPEIPEALEPYEALLEALPYNQFTLVSSDNAQADSGQEVRMPISGIFTFYAMPMQIMDGGSVVLNLRVEMLQDDGYRDALRAQGQAAPNQPLVMRGMPLNRGELVVVVEVRPDQDQQDGAGGDGDPDSDASEDDSDEQQDQDAEDDPDQEDEGDQDTEPETDDQGPQPQPDSSGDESRQESELDLQNVEALLEYLEEVDRREQEEIRRQRNDIEIRGDWW